MASRTRRLVCSEIGRLPVRTYETVLWDTPATRATSLLVYAAIANPLLTCCRYVSSIRIKETLAKLYSRVAHITRPLAQLGPPGSGACGGVVFVDQAAEDLGSGDPVAGKGTMS